MQRPRTGSRRSRRQETPRVDLNPLVSRETWTRGSSLGPMSFPEVLERAAAWAGWRLDQAQIERLDRYGRWLIEEAIPAGGLGPNEAERIWSRHIGDSLLFARGWDPPPPPREVIDLGSGVGLPGIPLAVLWPETDVLLVDRAGRRVSLARRATRVLGLDNVEVVQADAGHLAAEADLVVVRAVAEPDEVRRWGGRLLRPGGRLVVGGSWEERPAAEAGFEVIEVPSEVLDHPVWLRIMAAA